MSASVLHKAHIDLLVTAGMGWGTGRHALPWQDADGKWRTLDDLSADALGAMLWAENLASVAYRYPADKSGERPGPAGFEDTDTLTYRWEQTAGQWTPIDVIAAVACYECQTCEHPGWRSSRARDYVTALVMEMARRLPGYESAPWAVTPSTFTGRTATATH